MGVLEVVGHAADVTAMPFALIGFGVTFYQLHKTKKAARAAETEALRAVESVRRHSLIALIPELRRAEGDLEQAVKGNSRELLVSTLQAWQTQAGQARALLKMTGQDDAALLSDIQASIAEASTVRRGLLEDPEANLVSATRDVRILVATIANELSSVGTFQGSTIGGTNDA